uniref:Uncharacterized protein n=1 Tax=Oryza sativa subsp. japonica TaxID=39947 RepID=Q69PC7_ORYSJ|nr:hypothetical protein [Oryza sativa Japonica Group]BAD33600.1 hypothetical protein [Oryza sativa Japonica Group]
MALPADGVVLMEPDGLAVVALLNEVHVAVLLRVCALTSTRRLRRGFRDEEDKLCLHHVNRCFHLPMDFWLSV